MKLTVLQWNVWYKEDIHHIVDFLRDHPADVILLQKMLIRGHGNLEDHAPNFLAAQLGLRMHIQEIPITEDGQGINVATGIFTNLPIVATHYTWINQPTGAGGLEDQYSAYIEAKLDMPDGTPLSVGTTQMNYSEQFQDTPRKQLETQALMAQLTTHEGRYIFGGDLNATPASNTIETISSHLENVGPNLIEPTWTTKPFSYNGFEAHTLGWRLDYLFTTPDISVQSAEILPTIYSDHLPIYATLEY